MRRPRYLILPAALLLALTTAALGQPASPDPQPPTSAPSTAPSTNPATAPTPQPPKDEPPRKSYNQARTAFEAGDLAKAEAGFLAARDAAHSDAEVRFRAAFNLALTYARKADGLTKEKPQDALAALHQSAAWFRDAVHGRPGDADARQNLEQILRRIQQLADELNKGQNTLEARLGRVIQDERTLRDRIRALLGRVAQAGAATEPLSFQSEFEDLGTFQRTLLSDTGAILDLAGEQRDHISQQSSKQQSDEDRGKLVQLQNLEHYLNQGRGAMADTTRLLRRLQGDRAHQQADANVTILKRAMEQLQDPVTVLKGLVADQTALHGQTRALDELRKGNLRITPEGTQGAQPVKPEAPPWLTSAFLGEQERQVQPRTGELLARLKAGVEHAGQKPPPDPQQPQKPTDPRQEAQLRRMVESAQQAIPLLEQASGAMDRAASALGGDQLTPAAQAQVEALTGLLKALERFSGIRDLIELAYADQIGAVTLLTPEPPPAKGSKAPPSELSKLSTQERATLLKDAAARNQDRLLRLKGLFADELAALQGQGQGQADPNKKDEQEKLAAEKQRYELAEQKRQLAEAAVAKLGALLGGPGSSKSKPVTLLPTAEEGRKQLEELRRLFFSIVEHLKELQRNQTETHDGTSGAQALKDESAKRRKLGPLAGKQEEHAALGKALAEALASQADQAGSASDPQAKQAQKPLSEAAEEVHKAHGAMASATGMLKEDEKQAQTLSLDLEPPIEQQKQALAHIEAAIRILEPPQEKEQKQQQNKQQNQDQQISQEQAARRLQAIREREAERQRKKQQPSQPEPVEKDW